MLKKNIEETKAFIRLCHDVGGSGVKVRPNGLPAGVPVPTRRSSRSASARRSGRVWRRLRRRDSPGDSRRGHRTRFQRHARSWTSQHPGLAALLELQSRRLGGPGLAANFNRCKTVSADLHIHDLITTIPGDIVRSAQEEPLRRLDAARRRLAHERPDPRDEVLPAAVGTNDAGEGLREGAQARSTALACDALVRWPRSASQASAVNLHAAEAPSRRLDRRDPD